MGIQYNETLVESLGVAAYLPPVSKAASFAIAPPIYLVGVRKITYYILQGVVTGSAIWTPKLQCCSTSGGTYVDLQIGGAALPDMSTSATVPSVYEFRAEAIQQAIDAAATGTPGQFIQLYMTLKSGTSSILSALAFVTTGSYPSSDIVLNPWNTTTVGTANTTPILTKANTYVDGTLLNTAILPY